MSLIHSGLLLVLFTGAVFCQTTDRVEYSSIEVPPQGSISITSRRFPYGFPSGDVQTWNLVAPEGATIEIDSVYFAFYTWEDSLEIVDVANSWNRTIFRADGGPANYTSTGNVVFILFRAGFNNYEYSEGLGFNLTVRAIIPPTPPPTAPTAPPTTVAPLFNCETAEPILVDCARGRVSFSESDFAETDAFSFAIKIDASRGCSNFLYDAHVWILEATNTVDQKISRNKMSSGIRIVCNKEGVDVSDRDPEATDATSLAFTSSGLPRCRTMLVNFLTYLSEI